MPRYPQLLVALSLVAAACGAGEPASTVGVPTTATTQVASAAPEADAVAAPEAAAAVSDPGPSGVEGPVAPDFSLVLGDGTTFTLSEEAKPVYLVFWAEW